MFQASDITHGGSLRGLSEREGKEVLFLEAFWFKCSQGRRGELNKVG